MKCVKSFLDARYIPEPNSGCWLWNSFVDKNGYGIICTGSNRSGTRKYLKAHRLSYETFVGKIPTGLLVCHKCDVPSCINPNHLFLGSHADNVADMMKKNRHKTGGKPHPGETNPRAKLKQHLVDQIKLEHIPQKRGGTGSTSFLAKKYGVTRWQIQKIVAGKAWKQTNA